MPQLNYPTNRKPSSLWKGVAVACALLAVALVSGCGDNFSDLEVLPTESYMKKPGDFLGNTYSIRAQIDSQVKWDKEVGRILAVVPESGGARLPVFVPEAVGGNLHIGQRYEMRARIEEGGLIYVESLRKY
ncbi:MULTISPECIES: hypothetical protein [unclassified Lentimonas]|uniref:hypothetical protein n=1 Tax=unclassified Lentimonas TaxID=2630993 RepID=UPI00132864DC|nr:MULTISPECIES: hypothetical protein [unclassified Lentimonas]CAA6691181.1 Unannotated [Lentimonas sp. CC19]CAA6694737.1 Unannotated [Lentimonas sp. CC10]CAA7071561.1 Unannotated [Lentimonas sp. CC11]